MTLNEFILMVQSQLKARNIEVPNSIIIMHLNNTLKKIYEYFPDIYLTSDTNTYSEGISSITLPTDFGKFVKMVLNDTYEYFLEPLKYYNTRQLTHRCWLSENILYFTPETSEGDEIALWYYKKPADLTSLSDTIPLPDETHSDLALYVTSYIAPTNDLLMERQKIEMGWRRKYKRANPFREVKTWKDVVTLDNSGHYTGSS